MAKPAQTEKQFQAALVQYARLQGWRTYHTYDSRRSAPGFPDLVMVRAGRLVFAELKSEGGRLSQEQRAWLHDLRQVVDSVADAVPVGQQQFFIEVYVWRPSDWTQIEATLSV